MPPAAPAASIWGSHEPFPEFRRAFSATWQSISAGCSGSDSKRTVSSTLPTTARSACCCHPPFFCLSCAAGCHAPHPCALLQAPPRCRSQAPVPSWWSSHWPWQSAPLSPSAASSAAPCSERLGWLAGGLECSKADRWERRSALLRLPERPPCVHPALFRSTKAWHGGVHLALAWPAAPGSAASVPH